MTTLNPKTLIVAAMVLALAGACVDDAVDPSPAPTITNLQHDAPSELPVGTETAVRGTLDFSDADGDVFRVVINLETPYSEDTLQGASLDELEGQSTGTADWGVGIFPREPGEYRLTVQLLDKKDNLSNPLAVLFVAR